MVVDVVRASDLLHGSDLTTDTYKLDVYGGRKTPDATLHARDRVEILDPLITDPRTARRRRVQKVRVIGTCEGLKWLCNEAPSKDDVLE